EDGQEDQAPAPEPPPEQQRREQADQELHGRSGEDQHQGVSRGLPVPRVRQDPGVVPEPNEVPPDLEAGGVGQAEANVEQDGVEKQAENQQERGEAEQVPDRPAAAAQRGLRQSCQAKRGALDCAHAPAGPGAGELILTPALPKSTRTRMLNSAPQTRPRLGVWVTECEEEEMASNGSKARLA